MATFSVVIPCKNAERTIGQCIQSAIDQDHAPLEVIVIDDSSEDGSLKAIEAVHADLRIIRTDGVGGAAARNAGLKIAEGDWVAFLDADDIWYPDHLSRAGRFVHDSSLVGYISHYDWLGLDGRTIDKKRCRQDGVVKGCGLEPYIDLYVVYRHFVGMSACIVQRERAHEVSGFAEEMTRRHDIDFWLRLIEGRHWVFDPVASAAYRKGTPNSLSSNQADASLSRFVAFAKLENKLNHSAAYNALLRKFAFRALIKSVAFGSEEEKTSARKLACGHLSNGQRLLYRVLAHSPVASRIFLRNT